MVLNVQCIATNLEPKDTPVPLTVEQLTGIFKRYDTDKDWPTLSRRAQGSLRISWLVFSYYRAIMVRYKADKDKDGKINLANDELSELTQYAHSCGYKVKACEVANKY